MVYWWQISIILFLTIIFLLLLLSMFWPPDSPWAPWWSTNKYVARKMCKLAKISSKDNVYDLGCGTGTALFVACKKFNAKGIGVEIDPLRYWISKLKFKLAGLDKRVKVIKENFYNVNISRATVVFVYLVPRVLDKLRPKFIKELKPGTLIISYRYKINLPIFLSDKKNNIYLYKIKG